MDTVTTAITATAVMDTDMAITGTVIMDMATTTTGMATGIGTITIMVTVAGGAVTGMATAPATVGNGPRTATGGCATRIHELGRRHRSAPFFFDHAMVCPHGVGSAKAKEAKTTKELERLLLERCNAAGLNISGVTIVCQKGGFWSATFFAPPIA